MPEMRIISPVDNLAETSLLIETGADELYGGYLPPAWQAYDLAASLNQRTFAGAQIETESELAETIALAHRHRVPFSLTLNAPFFIDDQFPLLLDYVDRMVALGIDGLILADPGLLRVLKRRHPQLVFHASTLAHLTNAGAVHFMREQGFERIILPRHLTVAEMTAIVAQVPEVDFDAFLLVGKCPNSEGLCTFHHVSPERIWPCEIPYEVNPLTQPVSQDLGRALQQQQSWSRTDRRHGCGLCAIPHLRQAGIAGLKLVGRGAPAAQKARNVALAREFIALADACDNLQEYRRQAMAAHKARFGAACHQNVCYYPEFFDGGME